MCGTAQIIPEDRAAEVNEPGTKAKILASRGTAQILIPAPGSRGISEMEASLVYPESRAAWSTQRVQGRQGCTLRFYPIKTSIIELHLC